MYYLLGKWYLGFICLLAIPGLIVLINILVKGSRVDLPPDTQLPNDTPPPVGTPNDTGQ